MSSQKVYYISTKEGIERHCLNPECYDFLVPYSSSTKAVVERKLKQSNLPYKYFDENFFIVSIPKTRRDIFGKIATSMIERISEFFPSSDIAKLRGVSRSSTRFGYVDSRFSGILTKNILKRITQEKTIMKLDINAKQKEDDVKEIDLRPLNNLKVLKYTDPTINIISDDTKREESEEEEPEEENMINQEPALENYKNFSQTRNSAVIV
jgi:hypothetical protein